jgi:hypothetical protein
MTEEDFLARWSRRKREVAKEEAAPRAEKGAVQNQPVSDTKPSAEPEFDLASLPPVESINALTDVTQFLRDGVPADLARAALRRVWTADPAIRDFVGLSENAWDFTDPTAMPGFGPLESTEEIQQMITGIVDQIGNAAESAAADAQQSPSDSKALIESQPGDQPMRVAAAAAPPPDNRRDTADSEVLLQGSKVNTAMQHDITESEEVVPQSSRRSHGGALPR